MKILALKIKLKHLAEEARIIKHQEQKMRGKNWGAQSAYFREHRIHGVRPECRATHIAYGFLRGRTYEQIEGSRRRNLDTHYTGKLWARVLMMVRKYGTERNESLVKTQLRNWQSGMYHTEVA